MQFHDVSGKRFGKLIALKRVPNNRIPRATTWLCICDCGTEKIIRLHDMKSGHVRSCGCLKHRQKASLQKQRIYRVWAAYRDRAKTRGNLWTIGKEEFHRMVKEPCTYCGYSHDLCGIDRIDNTKGYSLENCTPCCGWCNIAKLNHTLDEFKTWAKELYEHLILHG